MKKYLFLLLMLMTCLHADTSNLVELRAGYFYFVNKDAREIYSDAVDLEIEENYLFKGCLSAFVNANLIWGSGESVGSEDNSLLSPTHMTLATASGGVKFFYNMKKKYIKPYAGAGLSLAGAWFNDMSDHLQYTKYGRASAGFVGKFGFLLLEKTGFVWDLFFDYYFQPVFTLPGSSLPYAYVDLGGFRTGVGLGFNF